MSRSPRYMVGRKQEFEVVPSASGSAVDNYACVRMYFLQIDRGDGHE